MSRALRHSPPLAERELIARPRLLAHLQGRFDRPVTAVVAAPGFGKTTLLAQAVRENTLSPMGQDHWLTCQQADSAQSFLVSGLFAALGVRAAPPDDPDEAVEILTEAILGAAPTQVALVLDDTHLIAPDSPGSRYLSSLVEELPRNGHLVLAARPPLQMRLTRLIATGDAIVLGERDMQFRSTETAQFAQARGVSAHLLGDIGGWPALAELMASVGPHAATEFVWEELLSKLSDARRHALALLVAIGGADEEIAAAIPGLDADLGRLLAGLPLVVRAPSGWRSLHGLWALALASELDAYEVAAARHTAGMILARRRQYHDAMDLLLDAAAWDDVRAVIVSVCEVCTPLVPPDVLGTWLRRLPTDVAASAEGLLLAAMVAEPGNPGGAQQLLEQALLAAPDSVPVRYACLNALVQLAFWRSDRRTMKNLNDQLADLARLGHAEAPGWTALLRALLAPSTDQVRKALAAPSLVSGAPLNPVQDWLHTHVVLLKLGDAQAAEVLARRAIAHEVSTMTAVSRLALLESFRLRGMLDEAEQVLAELLADLDPAKVLTSPELITCAVAVLDLLGRDDEAGRLLTDFGPSLDASPVTWARIAAPLARAFHHSCVGTEEAALAELAPILSSSVVRSLSAVQVSPVALPLLYVLAPELRARWEAEPPPGCLADQLPVLRALVALREGTAPDLGALTPHAQQLLRCILPGPWASQLTIALLAADARSAGAARTTGPRDVGRPVRAILREQASGPASAVEATARALLRSLPLAPLHRLQLTTLGPLELRIDDKPVVAADLRRMRVRQLLAYLLTHERPTRAAITADLWPDLADGAAARNLRVTLAYLQGVLEPDRHGQDPPYFVRTVGSSLHLIADESFDVDALRFDRLLDEAARLERQGAPSAALVAYEQAAELWQGEYFVDLPPSQWLQWERDRLRSRFVAAAVRSGNLELARDDAARARGLAERALAAEDTSERAYQLLVAAHLANDDIVSAAVTLQRCEHMLQELGAAADDRTRSLQRRLAAHR